MTFKLYQDVKEFYQDYYSTYMIHEAQNLIPLGNLVMGYKGEDKFDWRDPVNWIMASISDENGIRLCALMTPPYNLTIYAKDNNINDEAILCLIDSLFSH